MSLKILTPEEISKFPVAHYSPSAIRMLLIDQQQFCKQYIRWEFSEEKGKSLLEGNIFHKTLELFYNYKKENGTVEGFDWEDAFNEAFEYCENKGEVEETDFGKTGSLDKSLKATRQAIEFYINELPEIPNIIAVEESEGRVSIQDLEGNDLPIPLKGKIDLVWSDSEGKIFIEDHKTCAKFEENEDGDFAGKYFVQAHVYWLTVKHTYGVEAESIIFRQVKKSKNKDGGPQVVPYIQNITKDTLKVFFELYERITLLLAGKSLFDLEKGIMRFLPNPYDFMSTEGWLDFVDEVLQDQPQVFAEIEKARAAKFKQK